MILDAGRSVNRIAQGLKIDMEKITSSAAVAAPSANAEGVKRKYFSLIPNFILYGLPHLPLQDRWTLLTLVGCCPDNGPYKLSTREIAAITGVKHNTLRSMEGKTPREGILERLQRVTGYITLVEGKPINLVTRITGRAQTYIYIHHEKIWRDNSAFFEAQPFGMHRAVSEDSIECISGFCYLGTVHHVNSNEDKGDSADSKNTVHDVTVNVHHVNNNVHHVNDTVHDVTVTVHGASSKMQRNTINTINNTLNTNNTISLDSVESGEKDFSSNENLQDDEWRIADEEKTQELPSLQAVDELTQKRQAIKVPPAPPVAPPPAPASSKPSQPQKDVPPQKPPTTRNANKNTRGKNGKTDAPQQASLPIVLTDGASLVWNGWSGMYWFKNAQPKLTETAAAHCENLAIAGLGTIGLDALEEIKQIVAFGQKRFKDIFGGRSFELGDLKWVRPKWLSSRPDAQQTPSPSSSSKNTPSAPQTPTNEAERLMLEDTQKHRDGFVLWTRTVDDNLRQFMQTARGDAWWKLVEAIKWEWMTPDEATAHAWKSSKTFNDRERRELLEAQRRREKQATAA
jgi:hypothetical protein